MGRTKKKGKQRTHKQKDSTPLSSDPLQSEESQKFQQSGKVLSKPKYSVEQLLAKAEDSIDEFEFSLAHKFCQRALEIDPENVPALETCGTVLMEMGDLEPAKHCFSRAIELLPEVGHGKYMYLGQLLTGQEAIECFLKGIELMKIQIQKPHQNQNGGACTQAEWEVTPRDLSSAYCSVAELYLTDQCEEADAELKCKECLDQALNADNTNPETYQLLASYWLSKDEKQNASVAVEKGVALWLPQLKEAHESQELIVDPVQVCPLSYPARMSTAKTLVEVENYELASEILELLLDEEDEVVEVWYLLGWLNYLQDGEYKTNARFYLGKALQVAKKTKFDDAEMLQHIQQLQEELGPGEDEEADDDEAENGDESDSSSEEEENAMQEGQTDRNDTEAMEH